MVQKKAVGKYRQTVTLFLSPFAMLAFERANVTIYFIIYMKIQMSVFVLWCLCVCVASAFQLNNQAIP